jgi:hypothetical protein
LRPGSKHLCGQTCLHKLVDEFMAKSIAVRAQRRAEEADQESAAVAVRDTSLTSNAAYDEMESSARLITPPQPALPKPAVRPHPELVTMSPRPQHTDFAAATEETPRQSSRNWRAEAWEREREREQRGASKRSDVPSRRVSNA